MLPPHLRPEIQRLPRLVSHPDPTGNTATKNADRAPRRVPFFYGEEPDDWNDGRVDRN